MSELLAVGRVIRPHGIRGALVVEVISDVPERFSNGCRLICRLPDARTLEVAIESTARMGNRLLVHIAGVDNRNSAEKLRGCYLFIPAGDADELRDGEYWMHQLIGLTVLDHEGACLGRVEEVRDNPAYELLVVKNSEGKEFLVPFVKRFVKAVDIPGSAVTVSLIDGMGPE